MLGRSVASGSLRDEEALPIPPAKAEGREHGKEKNERHEHQSNMARGYALATASTRMVRYGKTLMTHGVHDPPWGHSQLGEVSLQK